MNNGSMGLSLVLIAVGAILTWAVEATVSGIDIRAVGVILMLIGLLGLVLAMLFWASFAPFGRRDDRPNQIIDNRPTHDHIIDDRPRTEHIIEERPRHDQT